MIRGMASAIVLAVTALVLVESGCRDTAVGPPDPRNFTWAADTFADPWGQMFQTFLVSVRGSSAKDVYLAGETSGGGHIYRYDGGGWAPVIFPLPVPPGIDYSFFDLYVPSPGRFYAVGYEYYQDWSNPGGNYLDSGAVIYYDGASCRPIPLPERGGVIDKIFGNGPDDIYVGGGDGLWHFDGTGWRKIPFPIHATPESWGAVGGLTGNQTGDIYVTLDFRPVLAQPRDIY